MGIFPVTVAVEISPSEMGGYGMARIEDRASVLNQEELYDIDD